MSKSKITIRQRKSLRTIDEDAFKNLSRKDQEKTIAIALSGLTCSVESAKAVATTREKNCLGIGIIAGGARRRRRKKKTPTPESSDDEEEEEDDDKSTQTAFTGTPASIKKAKNKDIYDLLSIGILTATAAGAVGMTYASGLSDGFNTVLHSAGIPTLDACDVQTQAARQMDSTVFGYNQVDYCEQAMDAADRMLIAVPIALTALCAFFGVSDAPTIISDSVKASQTKLASNMRNFFSGSKKAPKAPATLINAAAVSMDAHTAASAVAARSPPRDRDAVISATLRSATAPSHSGTTPDMQLSPTGNAVNLPRSAVIGSSPHSPTYSPHTPTPVGESMDSVSSLGSQSPVAMMSPPSPVPSLETKEDSPVVPSPSSVSSQSTRVGVRRSTRTRKSPGSTAGGKKKSKRRRKNIKKKKTRKGSSSSKKKTRKNKPHKKRGRKTKTRSR